MIPRLAQSQLAQARDFGFKRPSWRFINGPYTHNALQEHDDHIAGIVAECRDAVGAEMTLMVDVAYAWDDARTALRVIKQLEPFDLFFLETPINIDDLEGYAFICDHSPIRIAAGEWQNTHWEFIDLAHRGKLDVLQPDVGRVGGFTEARKVAQLAATTTSDCAPLLENRHRHRLSAHLGFATDCCPHRVAAGALSESVLRDELGRR